MTLLMDDEHVSDDILRWLKLRHKFIDENENLAFGMIINREGKKSDVPITPFHRPVKQTGKTQQETKIPLPPSSTPVPAQQPIRDRGLDWWHSNGYMSEGMSIGAVWEGDEIDNIQNAVLTRFEKQPSGDYSVIVTFKNGRTAEFTKYDHLKGFIQPFPINHPGVNISQDQGPAKHGSPEFTDGTNVYANYWQSGYWYAGKIIDSRWNDDKGVWEYRTDFYDDTDKDDWNWNTPLTPEDELQWVEKDQFTTDLTKPIYGDTMRAHTKDGFTDFQHPEVIPSESPKSPESEIEDKLPNGTQVQGNWYDYGDWYVGTIAGFDPVTGQYIIHYHDGDEEEGVPVSRIRDINTPDGWLETGVPYNPDNPTTKNNPHDIPETEYTKLYWVEGNMGTTIFDPSIGKWIPGIIGIDTFDPRTGLYTVSILKDPYGYPGGDNIDRIIQIKGDQILQTEDGAMGIDFGKPGNENINTRQKINTYLKNIVTTYNSGSWVTIDGEPYRVGTTLGEYLKVVDLDGKVKTLYESGVTGFATDPTIPTKDPEFADEESLQHYYDKVDIFDYYWDAKTQGYIYKAFDGGFYKESELDLLPDKYDVGKIVEVVDGWDQTLMGGSRDFESVVKEVDWDKARGDWTYLLTSGRDSSKEQWYFDDAIVDYHFDKVAAYDGLIYWLQQHQGDTKKDVKGLISEWADDYYRSATTKDLADMVEEDDYLRDLYEGLLSKHQNGDVVLYTKKNGKVEVGYIDSSDYETQKYLVKLPNGGHKWIPFVNADKELQPFETKGGFYVGQTVQSKDPYISSDYYEGKVLGITDDGVEIETRGEHTHIFTWDEIYKHEQVFGAVQLDHSMYVGNEYLTDGGNEKIKITNINNTTGEVQYLAWSDELREYTDNTFFASINDLLINRGLTDPDTRMPVVPYYMPGPDAETLLLMMEQDNLTNKTTIKQFAQIYPQYETEIYDALRDSDSMIIERMKSAEPGWDDWFERTPEEELQELYSEGQDRWVWTYIRNPDSDAMEWKEVRIDSHDMTDGYTYTNPFTKEQETKQIGRTLSLLDRTAYSTDDFMPGGEDAWYIRNDLQGDPDPRGDTFTLTYNKLLKPNLEIMNDPSSTQAQKDEAEAIYRREEAYQQNQWDIQHAATVKNWLDRHPHIDDKPKEHIDLTGHDADVIGTIPPERPDMGDVKEVLDMGGFHHIMATTDAGFLGSLGSVDLDNPGGGETYHGLPVVHTDVDKDGL